MKKSGRTAWDDDAISGVTEMARKNDELRRRIEGKGVRDEDASADEILSSSEDDDPSDADDDTAEFQRLQRQIQRAEEYGDVDEKASKLHELKFMRDAEARREKENHEAVQQMRRELEGEADSSASEGEQTIGRRIFAPNKLQEQSTPKTKEVRGELEEQESDAEDEVQIITGADAPIPATLTPPSGGIKASTTPANSDNINKAIKDAKAAKNYSTPKPASDPAVKLLPSEQHTQPDADGWVTVTYGQNGEPDGEEARGEAHIDQTEILRRAFAGDDVEDDFEAEKNATIEEEDEKTLDTTLPGWGSWVGSGLSKRDKTRRAPHANQLKKVEGIRPNERKDAKLKGVIVNQKRVKGNTKYLAGELPHLFGSKVEYERSIRMPVGGDWNVKSTFQDNVKPRVIVKPGAVVRPMEKPLL
jgi:U3 small nucleolar RNA-associated protein 14